MKQGPAWARTASRSMAQAAAATERPQPTAQPHPATRVTIDELFDARVHLGHKRGMWNPKMEPYIYTTLADSHIIDLNVTKAHLEHALELTRRISADGGVVLFVGGRPQFEGLIRHEARRCGEYFVTRKWIGGTLTNNTEARTSHRLVHGVQTLGGLRMPDLILFFCVPVSKVGVKEALDCDIPSVGIIDTDGDPDGVTYVVPGNDDTTQAIEFYVRKFADAVLAGKEAISDEQ
ncbi:uncharacterized protein MONBRDRAFT_21836 [Monosiga brevicollis MX1]|uniref:Small ribosomal subunit protein uS2m n=1 Tax=Monosiga brevicollis TaxID=81824 RepID=A9UNR6_MONBE|nr:uncharacterized protein MONBRDRAFT_21836 [Monosiga brevicollis MX1]EDQ92291.1 predicted protein [Monosiga brevicollis MX1]|eukprot:XP_001742053.1 hypothetical protein [Monosiga brevicollis MX1]